MKTLYTMSLLSLSLSNIGRAHSSYSMLVIVILALVLFGLSSASYSDVLWQLNAEASQVEYISVKKEHTAEINTFKAASGEDAALDGSITDEGEAVFTIDLNAVSTGVDIRNSRLLSLLFETEFLPTLFVRVSIDPVVVASMSAGETKEENVNGEITLHAVRQDISARVLIVKNTDTSINISSIEPVILDTKSFDLDAGIEALRVVANLSSIGEAVPVYFHLNYIAVTDPNIQPIVMPAVPEDPTDLQAGFEKVGAEASLNWLDNSSDESLFIVRRRPLNGSWETVAELALNTSDWAQSITEPGEYDYKVIALNDGVPSNPSNIERVTATEAETNPIVIGKSIYGKQCEGCHGENGEGVGNFPAVNTPRDIDTMVQYIADEMPFNNAQACDEECAKNVVAFLETIWVNQVSCDKAFTPVSYGARQLKILTRDEYQNSVKDLLGVDFNAAEGLSEDAKVGFFLNNTHTTILPSSYSNYLIVAEKIASWSADRDFAPALSCSSFNQDCADAFMDSLAPMIFRRPLSDAEKTAYESMANGSRTEGDVKSGIQMALEGMLSSPQFLYRHELGELNPDNSDIDGDAFELTSYEMATYLAYTFTGSTPDQTLLDAAANDQLRDTANIESQAKRLAANASNVMGSFVGSWLGTADLDIAAKDNSAWAGFEEMVPHMQSEINQNFSHVMTNPDESFASLYKASYTHLNEKLADHYGIAGVSGDEMRRVDTAERGGILANGAFMARWGESLETSPILRSVRVRRRMLCQDQPAPPAGTFAAREKKLAELSEFLQDPATTNRDKYHRLTEDSPCTNCHLQYINPLGFGMEDFDTVGRFRATDSKGNSIDASGQFYAPVLYSDIDEVVNFTGARGLAEVVAGLESAQSCLPKQLFRYFMGVGHQSIDASNPDGAQLATEEMSGYACEIDKLTDTMLNDSPRSMLESFGSLEAVRYRKAWSRNTLQ